MGNSKKKDPTYHPHTICQSLVNCSATAAWVMKHCQLMQFVFFTLLQLNDN